MLNPGHTFIGPNGGKIKQSITGSPTERLLIIGTAVDGPINSPVTVTTGQDIVKWFGPAKYTNDYLDPNTNTETGRPNGATIPLAVNQALAAGATNIIVVRVTGTVAQNASAFTNKLDIRAIYPGSIYNQVSIQATSASGGAWGVSGTITWTHTQPQSKGGAYTIAFSASQTFEDLIQTINADPRNRTIFIARESWPSLLTNSVSGLLPPGITATAGLSGTILGLNETDAPGEALSIPVSGKALYATRLTTTDTGTFDTLEGEKVRFNVAVLTGLYIDDEVSYGNASLSAAYDFVTFLTRMSLNVLPCHGVMGTRPSFLRDKAALINYVNNALLSTSAGYYNSALKWTKAGAFLYNGFLVNTINGGQVDAGGRLSVCAGTDCLYTHPDIGQYADNFHVTYAGMLTALAPERAATFRVLPGVLGFVNRIPGKYADYLVSGVGYDGANDLSGHGAYVCLIPDENLNGQMKIYSDVTAAFRDDPFRQNQLMHLCNAIFMDIDAVLRPFIGRDADMTAMAAMKSAVQNVLDGYYKAGAFRGPQGTGYDFQIMQVDNDPQLGIVRCYLELLPAAAIQRIITTMDVKQGSL